MASSTMLCTLHCPSEFIDENQEHVPILLTTVASMRILGWSENALKFCHPSHFHSGVWSTFVIVEVGDVDCILLQITLYLNMLASKRFDCGRFGIQRVDLSSTTKTYFAPAFTHSLAHSASDFPGIKGFFAAHGIADDAFQRLSCGVDLESGYNSETY